MCRVRRGEREANRRFRPMLDAGMSPLDSDQQHKAGMRDPCQKRGRESPFRVSGNEAASQLLSFVGHREQRRLTCLHGGAEAPLR